MVSQVNRTANGDGGWQDFSVANSVLKAGCKWNNGNVVQQIGAHTVIPVTLVAAAAIDAVSHALATVLKLAAFTFNAALYAITLGNVGINAAWTPSQVVTHAYKSAMSVAYAVVGPLISVFSPCVAHTLARNVGLAPSEAAPLGWWENLKQGMPEGGAWEKTKYVAQETFNGVVDGVASIGRSVAHHTWTKWEGRRAEQFAYVGAAVALYAGLAAWRGGVFKPFEEGRDLAANAASVTWATLVTRPWNYITGKQDVCIEEGKKEQELCGAGKETTQECLTAKTARNTCEAQAKAKAEQDAICPKEKAAKESDCKPGADGKVPAGCDKATVALTDCLNTDAQNKAKAQELLHDQEVAKARERVKAADAIKDAEAEKRTQLKKDRDLVKEADEAAAKKAAAAAKQKTAEAPKTTQAPTTAEAPKTTPAPQTAEAPKTA